METKNTKQKTEKEREEQKKKQEKKNSSSSSSTSTSSNTIKQKKKNIPIILKNKETKFLLFFRFSFKTYHYFKYEKQSWKEKRYTK